LYGHRSSSRPSNCRLQWRLLDVGIEGHLSAGVVCCCLAHDEVTGCHGSLCTTLLESRLARWAEETSQIYMEQQRLLLQQELCTSAAAATTAIDTCIGS
jgi:hypothetical protein